MATYSVTFKGNHIEPRRETVKASSLNAAFGKTRHLADIARAGRAGELVSITIERVS